MPCGPSAPPAQSRRWGFSDEDSSCLRHAIRGNRGTGSVQMDWTNRPQVFSRQFNAQMRQLRELLSRQINMNNKIVADVESLLRAASTIEECYALIESLKANPEPIVRAAARYVLRRDRIEHPEGATDNGGRWYPAIETETELVIGRIRPPSRAWPWSYMLACRSLRHCCALEDLKSAKGGRKVVAALDRAISRAQSWEEIT